MINFNVFLEVFALAWASNIALNLLGTLKMYNGNIRSYDRPIDGGLRIKGKRLIGDSSTVFGLLMCLLLAALFFFLMNDEAYGLIPILVFIGDSLGSMIKRSVGFAEGRFLPVIDHGDYMILVTGVLVVIDRLTIITAVCLLVATYVLHPVVVFIAYKCKLRIRPY